MAIAEIETPELTPPEYGGTPPGTMGPSAPTELPSRVRLRRVLAPKPRCSHCLVVIPVGEVAPYGLCRVCLETEGPPIVQEVEEAGVRAARAAGIHATARPCNDTDCKTCVSMRGGPVGPYGMSVGRQRHSRDAQFTYRDEENLKRYFGRALRSGIGGGPGSGLGALIARLGETTNHQTSEMPARTEPRCPVCAAKLVRRSLAEKTVSKRRDNRTKLGLRPGIVTQEKLRKIIMGEDIAPAEEAPIPPPPLTEAQASKAASPLVSTHRHSKVDVEAFKPIRVYDKELGGRLIQVQVFAPSIEPHTYESHRIQTDTSEGSGKFGSWDEQAVEYVHARLGEPEVTRVLAHLSELHQAVLEDYYAANEEWRSMDQTLGAFTAIVIRTKTLQKLHDDEGEKTGSPGTLRDTLLALKRRANGTGTGREAANNRLSAMRKEAETMLLDAQVAYGWAAAAYA